MSDDFTKGFAASIAKKRAKEDEARALEEAKTTRIQAWLERYIAGEITIQDATPEVARFVMREGDALVRHQLESSGVLALLRLEDPTL